MQGTNWVKVSECLPKDYMVVLTKSNGAIVRAIFIHDEEKNPTFIHFSRNGKRRILGDVTEWYSPTNARG
ncbi:hypothetical protein M0L11_RS16425 [Providencia rettgeri]|nr:hypothetical protein [Providencia rettgeri]